MTLRQFLRWWGEQLAGSLPSALRSPGGNAGASIVVKLVSPPGIMPAIVEVTQPSRRHLPPRQQTVTLTDTGLEQLRAALGPRRPASVRLRLPPGNLLERDGVVLPIAAEHALDEVLRYDLDRLTPFRAEDLLWGFEVTKRDRARGRLSLRLTFARIAMLAPLLDNLRSAGIVPDVLEAEPAPGVPSQGWRRIALGSTGRSRPRRGLRVSWAICAALAVAAGTVPFVRQSLTLGAIQARIDALRPAVVEAETLRRRVTAAAGGGDVI